MALTSALFTGLSGLDVNQTRLNVVGNNIANVNTVAFKSSRALFQPQFYVTDGAGTPPSSDFGGTNPSQRGLGASVASISRDFTPGSIEPTGQPTDLALDGEGFFVVQGKEQNFTRDGSFTLNSSNQLVTSSGDFVQGYTTDAAGNVSSGSLQDINIPLGTTTAAKATTQVTLEGNLNSSGPVASGASVLATQLVTTVGGTAPPTGTTLLTSLADASANTTPIINVGDTYSLAGHKGGREMAPRTFTVTAASTINDLNSFLQGAMGVDTTVPASSNPQVPTPGATLEIDATNPNAGRLVLAGNTGTDNALAISGSDFSNPTGAAPFTFADSTNNAGVASNPAGESVHTTFVGYDSLGSPVSVDMTAVLESKADTGNTWRFYTTSGDDTDTDQVLGNGTLTFDSQGSLKSSTGTAITIDRANTGAKTPLSISLDFGSMTSLTSKDSTLAMTKQDGSQIGTLNSFSIGAEGQIVGSFSNGQTKTLGQVAVATFSNNQGLIDRGGNQFAAGSNSGVPVISTPGQLGSGLVRSGALEQSNVDLSKEFVNLIISSTGFSASSRVISTSDQLITELLNSSR